MGVYADLISGRKTFSNTSKTYQKLTNLAAIADPALPAAFAAANEVQTIGQEATVDDGSYFVRVTLANGITYITAELAFDTTGAEIQTALNTVSPASVGDDHIVVTGTDIFTTDLVFTFSGASVAGANHPLIVLTGELLAGLDPVVPVVTRTTIGQASRTAWAGLLALGLITDTTPPAPLAPTAPTAGANRLKLKSWLIRDLAQEAAAQDNNNDTYHLISSALLVEDRSPLMEVV